MSHAFFACPSRGAAIGLSVALAGCSFPDVAFEAPDAPVDVVMASVKADGALSDPSSADRLDEGGSAEAPNDANLGQGGSSASSGGSSTSSGGSSGSSGGSSGASGGGGQDGAVNCSCNPSQMYPTNVDCAAIQVTLINLGVACKGAKGFIGSGPSCGQPAAFVTCNADLAGLLCTETMSTVVQQCL